VQSFERVRERPDALAPGCHTHEYGFKSDGLASRLWLSTISVVSGILAPKISHA